MCVYVTTFTLLILLTHRLLIDELLVSYKLASIVAELELAIVYDSIDRLLRVRAARVERVVKGKKESRIKGKTKSKDKSESRSKSKGKIKGKEKEKDKSRKLINLGVLSSLSS
ncbi:hypothetical protein NA57DRAFT_51924 [Rhizodiscina lignyota]|uniref:Uncharacterized protein n=1 Tax=Rhizodiscina lignyota TaxID=1504668 RepID=A0A9P4MF64_9PEZI|nr:hypothetical protein NA57DRAFT_51924 [Rhizodiscina lignyota]